MQLCQSKRVRLDDPYITAGDRLYAIGTQDGLFPPIGTPSHMPDEMGGIWMNDIKLLDGFWAYILDGTDTMPVRAQCISAYPEKTVFNSMLDGHGLEITRTQFVPDALEAMVIRYEVRNKNPQRRDFTFRFAARTKLLPAWLGERIGLTDGQDTVTYDDECGIWSGSDANHPWSVVIGSVPSGEPCRNAQAPVSHGMGAVCAIDHRLSLDAGECVDLVFVVAGAKEGKTEALTRYRTACERQANMLETKARRMDAILRSGSMDVPEAALGSAIEWQKVNYDWLMREVSGFGRGLGAGMPEYPWWFGCDNGFALLGMLPYGRFEEAVDTMRLLRDVSNQNNGNGRIIHEVSFNGVVYNLGNTQETAHFIKTVWEIYLWTGDESFLQEMLPTVRQGIAWLRSQAGEDLFPVGYGIIEIAGLNMKNIDTAVLTQRALHACGMMYERLGEAGADELNREAEVLAENINREFWREQDGEYGDFRAVGKEVLERSHILTGNKRKSDGFGELVGRVIKESEQAGDKEELFNLRNWVINAPMQEGIAPRDKAVRALASMHDKTFFSRFGVNLAGAEDGLSAMTVSSGTQAEANGRYGRIEEMLGCIAQTVSMFHIRTPGAASEVCPDRGCFVQAWTGYTLIWPIVTCLFGVRPDAGKRRVYFDPKMPMAWPKWSYRSVRIGGEEFTFKAERENEGLRCQIVGPAGWEIIYIQDGMQKNHILNGDEFSYIR